MPLTVVSKITSQFILWLIFTIIIGLCGVIISICLNFSEETWQTIMRSGSLYNIGIAMCSSFVSIFLSNIIKFRNDLKFISYKIVCVAIGILLMFLMSGFYSSLMTGKTHTNIIQYVLYLISILLCTYSFCVENMEQHYEDYKELDDKAVENIKTKAKTTTTDGGGIKI
jgi:hypothetical protein